MRRSMWGTADGSPEADEMGHTILGDVIGQAPQPSNGIGVLGSLAIAALGASVPVAGVGGYLLSQYFKDPPAITQPVDDESVELGLGRIEDLQAE